MKILTVVFSENAIFVVIRAVLLKIFVLWRYVVRRVILTFRGTTEPSFTFRVTLLDPEGEGRYEFPNPPALLAQRYLVTSRKTLIIRKCFNRNKQWFNTSSLFTYFTVLIRSLFIFTWVAIVVSLCKLSFLLRANVPEVCFLRGSTSDSSRCMRSKRSQERG